MSAVLFIDEDHLNPRLLLNKIDEQCLVIFPWDKSYFESRSYSFKQLFFFYESLLDEDVNIYLGELETVVNSFRKDEQTSFYMPMSLINRLSNEFLSTTKVTSVDLAALTEQPDHFCNRFFQYWREVKKQVMS